MENAQDFLEGQYCQKKSLQEGPPGIAICIIDQEKKSFAQVGVKALDNRILISPHDKWHLGSCGKSMTAYLLFKLAEEKKINLNSTIGQILVQKESHAKSQEVSLLQLLSHTSGLTNRIPKAILEILRQRNLASNTARARLTDFFLATEKEWALGNDFNYSNWGYVILGHIVDVIAGDFESVLENKVFKALKMETAGFGAPFSNAQNCQPKGHCYFSKTFHTIDPNGISDNHPGLSPAGRMHCSIRDWANLIYYLLERYEQNKMGNDLFFESPPHSKYIYGGFMTEGMGEQKRFFHYGSNTFWYSSASMYPRQKKALLVATNWGGVNNVCWVNKALQDKFRTSVLR